MPLFYCRFTSLYMPCILVTWLNFRNAWEYLIWRSPAVRFQIKMINVKMLRFNMANKFINGGFYEDHKNQPRQHIFSVFLLTTVETIDPFFFSWSAAVDSVTMQVMLYMKTNVVKAFYIFHLYIYSSFFWLKCSLCKIFWGDQ